MPLPAWIEAIGIALGLLNARTGSAPLPPKVVVRKPIPPRPRHARKSPKANP